MYTRFERIDKHLTLCRRHFLLLIAVVHIPDDTGKFGLKKFVFSCFRCWLFISIFCCMCHTQSAYRCVSCLMCSKSILLHTCCAIANFIYGLYGGVYVPCCGYMQQYSVSSHTCIFYLCCHFDFWLYFCCCCSCFFFWDWYTYVYHSLLEAVMDSNRAGKCLLNHACVPF